MSIDRSLIASTGQVPDGKHLIRDLCVFQPLEKVRTVSESAGGDKVMRVRGIFQMADVRNANGRIYPAEVLQKAVEEIQEDVQNRSVLGEYDHPSDAKIHMDRVSHLITKLWMEGNKVYGEAEVLHKLPMGAQLRGMFEHNVRVGISSRGVGDMELIESNDGEETYLVQPGYSIVTFDVVAEPSVQAAVLHQLNESRNIAKKLRKRLKPIREAKNQLPPSVYNRLIVREIEHFFGLD